MNASDLDVNIHPNKKEVRFNNEGEISEFISQAIKKALGTKEAVVRVANIFKEEPTKYTAKPIVEEQVSLKNITSTKPTTEPVVETPVVREIEVPKVEIPEVKASKLVSVPVVEMPKSVEIQTIDTVEETVKSVGETAKEFPSLKDVIKAISADSRVGHFIVDIVSGMNVVEASKLHFPHDDVADESQNPSIDTLVSEAEERGYLRGRNEQIEMAMRQFKKENESSELRSAPSETTILNHPRRSVWEK